MYIYIYIYIYIYNRSMVDMVPCAVKLVRIVYKYLCRPMYMYMERDR